jgi:FkbM family methyltransferase
LILGCFSMVKPVKVFSVIRGFLFATRLYNRFKHGIDAWFDMRKHVNLQTFKVVFDVGANVGQSSQKISLAFPKAEAYCFEPIQNTFFKLKQNTKDMPRVHCFNIALGSSPGKVEVELQEKSIANSLVVKSYKPCKKTETVRVDTLDRFCDEHGIDCIDFLKIDTEGYDLEVLKGAENMLTSCKVNFIQVEAGMDSTDKEYVPFQAFIKHLESKGYFLFGVYDQTLTHSPEPRLNFCNAIFVRSSLS